MPFDPAKKPEQEFPELPVLTDIVDAIEVPAFDFSTELDDLARAVPEGDSPQELDIPPDLLLEDVVDLGPEPRDDGSLDFSKLPSLDLEVAVTEEMSLDELLGDENAAAGEGAAEPPAAPDAAAVPTLEENEPEMPLASAWAEESVAEPAGADAEPTLTPDTDAVPTLAVDEADMPLSSAWAEESAAEQADAEPSLTPDTAAVPTLEENEPEMPLASAWAEESVAEPAGADAEPSLTPGTAAVPALGVDEADMPLSSAWAEESVAEQADAEPSLTPDTAAVPTLEENEPEMPLASAWAEESVAEQADAEPSLTPDTDAVPTLVAEEPIAPIENLQATTQPVGTPSMQEDAPLSAEMDLDLPCVDETPFGEDISGQGSAPDAKTANAEPEGERPAPVDDDFPIDLTPAGAALAQPAPAPFQSISLSSLPRGVLGGELSRTTDRESLLQAARDTLAEELHFAKLKAAASSPAPLQEEPASPEASALFAQPMDDVASAMPFANSRYAEQIKAAEARLAEELRLAEQRRLAEETARAQAPAEPSPPEVAEEVAPPPSAERHTVSVIKVAGVAAASAQAGVPSSGTGRTPIALVNENVLIDSLYQRILPHMKVELSLWLQDALEAHAKQMMANVMHQFKEDYEMLFSDTLRESLRQAVSDLGREDRPRIEE